MIKLTSKIHGYIQMVHMTSQTVCFRVLVLNTQKTRVDRSIFNE